MTCKVGSKVTWSPKIEVVASNDIRGKIEVAASNDL